MMDRKLLRNPFDNDVVTSLEQALPADVREIHREPFDLCRQTYEAMVRERFSLSVLLYGEAGCGKTHLLSRFRRWLSGGMETPPSLIPALLVAVRLETAPSQIWRHIRRRFAEELTRRAADGSCALDRILDRFAAPHAGNLRNALETAEIEDFMTACWAPS
jgi:GTPase SAR1 family protein